jgi:WhiB family redox-sensing transcriptional regulator
VTAPLPVERRIVGLLRGELLAVRAAEPEVRRVEVHVAPMPAPSSAWRQLAACRGKPLSWWYPPPWDRFADAVARSICRTCPVRLPCLAYALEHDGDYPAGIFGGLGARQRMALRRRRRGFV